jgi:hypothetical protein
MHTNLSLSKDGSNMFYDAKGKYQLSDFAYRFIAGVLSHANDICLTMNSSVNAYRRLDPAFEAPGVKEKGGVLVRSLSEVEVEALPADIPHSIEVDVKVLTDVGMSIPASAVNLGRCWKLTKKSCENCSMTMNLKKTNCGWKKRMKHACCRPVRRVVAS